MAVDATTLNAFMDAVTNAYGADVWQGITSNEAFYAADFASKVTQVEGVSAVYNNAGNIMYYKYGENIVGTAADVSNVINSNAGASTIASKIDIPGNTATAAGGTVAATSGMKTAATGASVATVVKNVAFGVLAVGAGAQLGATIDSVLYNLNPDFWDEHNMSRLNPETWDEICVTEAGQNRINMVFGINKDTGNVQAYADQNAVAYIAQYMASEGAFSFEYTSDVPTTDTHYAEVSPYMPVEYCKTASYFHHTQFGDQTKIFVVDGDATLFVAQDPDTERYAIYAASPTSTGGTVTEYLYSYSGDTVTTYPIDGSRSMHLNGENINFYCHPGLTNLGPQEGYELLTGVVNVGSNYYSSAHNGNQYVWYPFLTGQTVKTGGIDGIGEQPGGIIPEGLTSDMTLAQVLAALQTQYPDLFNDAIYQDVIQPDGTTVRHTYIPVGIPDNVPYDEIANALKPTGGTQLQQSDTTINGDSTEDLIDTLLKILTSADPDKLTKTDVETDYPDTGTGEPPAFVLPSGSASALYSIYNPTQAELNSFGSWLWSSNFVDQILKIFNDPMQAIIGLHKVFVTPPVSGTGTITVGYLDSGVSSNLVSNQYTEVNCGSVNLLEYFGNALDYLNTDVYLYLPFIGIVPLNTSDVMRGKIGVKYKVDVLTGACMASVTVTRDNAGGQLYTYAGNCAVQYPLSSGSYMGIVTGALGIAGSVAGTILSGGALLPMALGASAAALSQAKTKVEHSGSLSGNAGAMGIKKPYLIIRRPQTKIADNFKLFNGESENIYGVLSGFTGFTKIKYINPESIPATGDELSEIERILKEGVLI